MGAASAMEAASALFSTKFARKSALFSYWYRFYNFSIQPVHPSMHFPLTVEFRILIITNRKQRLQTPFGARVPKIRSEPIARGKPCCLSPNGSSLKRPDPHTAREPPHSRQPCALIIAFKFIIHRRGIFVNSFLKNLYIAEKQRRKSKGSKLVLGNNIDKSPKV